MLELSQSGGALAPIVGFLPVALVFIAAEALYVRLARHDEPGYHAGETAASIAVAFGQMATRALNGMLAAVPFLWAYEHRVATMPLDQAWAWAVLFFAVEFCYYWFHRASHTVRWLWATHAVHHSAQHFNLSAAIRLGWTGQLSGAFVFFLPLAWLGFHPLAIGGMLTAGLIYQFFLHTHLDVRLGPLEWILNTPAHHRVHHASNDSCLDRNFGGVLIVFDRLFGTFSKAPANEPLVYGLKGRALVLDPINIALGEWTRLFGDASRARGFVARLRVLFGKP